MIVLEDILKRKNRLANTGDLLDILISGSKSWICLVLFDSDIFLSNNGKITLV